jgi:hypothetical protein
VLHIATASIIHQIISQHLGSFLAGTEDWTEKSRVFFTNELRRCGASESEARLWRKALWAKALGRKALWMKVLWIKVLWDKVL